MAYFAMVTCIGCGRPFGCNPHLVPSITHLGERAAICQNCVNVANPQRKAKGLAEIMPAPGAYDVVAEETDTDFGQRPSDEDFDY